MTEDIINADGIAVRLLLVAVVLTGGAVGAIGHAPVTSQLASDAIGESLADDRAPHLMFPINNGSGFWIGQTARLRFPINNGSGFSVVGVSPASGPPFPVTDGTPTMTSRDVTGTGLLGGDEISSVGMAADAFARTDRPDGLPQDMDPY